MVFGWEAGHARREIAATDIEKLDAGACFLFSGYSGAELGMVVNIDRVQKGFLAFSPTDPNSNDVPHVFLDHVLANERISYLPDATIKLPESLEDITYTTGSFDYREPLLYHNDEGLMIRALYRGSTLIGINLLNGFRGSASGLYGVAYKNWKIVLPQENGEFGVLKEFGKKADN